MENVAEPTNLPNPERIMCEQQHTRIPQRIVVTRRATPLKGVPKSDAEFVNLRAHSHPLRDHLQRGRGPERSRLADNFEIANPSPIPEAIWQEVLMAIASSRRNLYTEFRPKMIAAGERYRFDELSLEQIEHP